MLVYLPSDFKALYNARQILMSNSYGVDNAIAKVPDRFKKDIGLEYDRLKWRNRRGRLDGSLEIFMMYPNEPSTIENYKDGKLHGTVIDKDGDTFREQSYRNGKMHGPLNFITTEQKLEVTLKKHKAENKLLEAQRLEERTKFDLEMIEATGSCAGIENYSRFLSGRKPGEPPPTLFEYFPDNTLIFVDESHVTVPQLNGMYKGDRSRKSTLSEYGFRLPSCMDNRPLKFEEWDLMRTQTVFVSATPGPWELEQTKGKYIDQVIRPTGLIDPPVEIKPAKNQVDDLMYECKKVIENNHRVLVTTLTKKMAEDLTEYLHELSLIHI